MILFLRDAGFTLQEVKQLMAGRAGSPRAWRTLAHQKLEELSQQIQDLEIARVVLEHGLACPEDDILECPHFWATVGARLDAGEVVEPRTAPSSGVSRPRRDRRSRSTRR